jgi:hypothetical protein
MSQTVGVVDSEIASAVVDDYGEFVTVDESAVVVVVVVLHEDILRSSSWRMEALKWIQMTSFVSVNLTTQKMIY